MSSRRGLRFDVGGRGPGRPILKVVQMSDPVNLGLATTSHKNGTSVTAQYRKCAVGPLTSFPELATFNPARTGGRAGLMGIREVIDNGITNQDQCYASLVSGTGTIVDYQAPVLNIYDGGLTTRFGGDLDFGVVTQRKQGHGSVDNLSLVARGTVHIPVGGLYTFCVSSDDGFTLQFPGHASSDRRQQGRTVSVRQRRCLRFFGSRARRRWGDQPACGSSSSSIYHEGASGSSVEFSGCDRRQAFDADFQLVGYETGYFRFRIGGGYDATKPALAGGVWNIKYLYDMGELNGTLVSGVRCRQSAIPTIPSCRALPGMCHSPARPGLMTTILP
jgi:hypothetical protein